MFPRLYSRRWAKLVAAVMLIALVVGLAHWHQPDKFGDAAAEAGKEVVRSQRTALREQAWVFLREHQFKMAWVFARSSLGIQVQSVLQNTDGTYRVKLDHGSTFIMQKDGTNWVCICVEMAAK